MPKGLNKGVNLTANKQSSIGFVRKDLTPSAVKNAVKIGETDFDLSGLPPCILNSKHFETYFDWLRANWSVRECEKHAKGQYGEAISYVTFSTAKKILNERGYILPNYKASLLKGVELPHIDPIQEMRNKIMLAFRTIEEMYNKEKEMQGETGYVPYVLNALQVEKDSLSRDLVALFQMEIKQKEFNLHRNIKLGISDRDIEELPDTKVFPVITEEEIRQTVASYTKEQADAMRMAIMWADKIYYLDMPEHFDELIVSEFVECCVAYSTMVSDFSRITEYVALVKEEIILFRAQDIRVTEFVRLGKE